ncbi:hypothetical protein JAO76_17055 [Pontibacter sp. BT310]|uniref:SWFGD domain-containing protein n=1 Tax=Pontibacter populi TaxID=890055 RepID=A0ABS6XFL1_9BACT|nr:MULTISPECIES: hypothetical protein [Pontibacter]MBJ6119919.1 hypothetical protein [Pontibacter sp. BT310]MBR0572348.1 hypothetical protein [Microvirga sp. STS03]MBW3366772.1 hypothetical protein [Pontibacter populi]
MANYNENEENKRVNREQHRSGMEQNLPQQRYGYRSTKDQKWDEGNYFHTGPSRSGAQDRENRERTSGPSQQRFQNKDQNAHLNEHYGSRPNSAYRNERSYLDHGDSFGSSHYNPQQSAGWSQQSNYNQRPTSRDEQYQDLPGDRSRYKESDFRYGSGTHNWYQEGRFTPDSTPEPQRDNRSFFGRIKDTWNDIMHSDDPDYRPSHGYPTDEDRRNERKRYGNDLYNRQQFERGYEGGPRWADETDSGKDNYYDDADRTQRFRRY